MLLLLTPFFCLAQKKGDNTIIVYGGSQDIESLGKFLMNKGYRIKTIDRELGILYTDHKDIPGYLYSYRVDFKEMGGKIYGKIYIKKNFGSDAPASWKGGDRKPHKVTYYHAFITLSNYGKSVNSNIKSENL